MTTTAKKTTTKPKVVKAKSTPIPNLPKIPFAFEVFDAASKQRTKAKKIEVLQRYAHDSIMALFILNFDESIVSMLPEGEVPYGDPNEQSAFDGSLSENISREMSGGQSATGQDLDGRNKTSLSREWTSLYHFVRGGNDALSKTRREMMFINLLRGLHPREAELLILVKDGLLTDKYRLTKNMVAEAYPDITWGGRS